MAVIYLKRGKPEAERTRENTQVRELVEKTLADIDARGDAAVRELSKRFDNFSRRTFRLTGSEIESAISKVSARDMADIRFAQEQIRRFAGRSARQ